MRRTSIILHADELAELLRHVRALVRQDRADLDEALVRTRTLDRNSARERLLSYLDGLRDEIRLGGQDAGSRTLRAFADVRTATGGPVRGVVLDMVGQDAQTYGTQTIDLAGSAELDSIVAQLSQFIGQILES